MGTISEPTEASDPCPVPGPTEKGGGPPPGSPSGRGPHSGRCPQQDSNLRPCLRRAVLYPLSYGGQRTPKAISPRVPPRLLRRSRSTCRATVRVPRTVGGVPRSRGSAVDVALRLRQVGLQARLVVGLHVARLVAL